MLMYELGIYSCDEFEQQLVEFFESGLFSADNIETVIERYVTETKEMDAREAASKFLERTFWEHRVSEAELVSEASKFPGIASLLDPYIATQLATELAKMSEGAPIGEAIIDCWINGFMAKKQTAVNDENPFNNPQHPKIKNLFDQMRASAQANKSILEACMDIIQNNGWGTIEEQAMRRATAADFEATIRSIEDVGKFRRFMRRMIEMRLQREMYDHHFGSATEHFVEACRVIANDKNSPRLSALVKRLFEGTALQPELALEPITEKQ